MALTNEPNDPSPATPWPQGAEALLNAFYNSVPLVMGIVELVGLDDIRHISDNATSASFFGLEPHEMVNRLASEMNVPLEARRMWIERYRESERRGEPVRFEYSQVRGDGVRILKATVCPIESPLGWPKRFCYVVDDVTERRRWEESERTEAVRAQAMRILESVTDAFLAIDRDGRFSYLNPQTEPILRRSREDLVGRSLWACFPGLAGSEFERQVLHAIGSGTPVRFEAPFPSPETWCDVRAYPDAEGLSVYFQDITERKRIEAELHERAEALARADRSKDEFLAMLSHELRNPLGAVSNAAHLLQARPIEDPKLQRASDIVARQVQHMTRLVDDLLDVSRITRGKIEFQPSPVQLAGVVEHAVDTIRPLADQKSHRITLTLPEIPLCVNGDATRLEQVVINILNNAVKYTEPGGVIRVSCRPEGGEAVVCVEDNGIGIPANVLPNVFDLFRQSERGTDRSQGGLGVGLTVVKRLVEMHGGTVSIASEGPNRGTKVIIQLPLCREYWEGDAGPSSGNAGTGTGRRVLIVDDVVDAAETVGEILTGWGYTVLFAHDGQTALEAIRTTRPDVVLLDIGLPKLDGLEVARRVRSDRSLDTVKLIAVTGYGSEEEKRLAERAGFDRHVVKPIDLPALREILLHLPR